MPSSRLTNKIQHVQYFGQEAQQFIGLSVTLDAEWPISVARTKENI